MRGQAPAVARALATLLLASLALALPVAGASASGGRIDQSFGRHGRALIGQVSDTFDPFFVAAAPGSGIVVVNSSQIVRIDSRGHLDRGFGEGGLVEIPVAAGTEFEPAGLAVDERGRIAIAGTAVATGAPYPRAQTVVVERLLSDGELDPSFGAGGRFESTLGLPAAPGYGAPTVAAAGLTLDARGRPLIAGSFVVSRQTCETYMATFYTAETSQGFLARLTPRGRLDPGFADSGVHTEPTASFDSLPLVDRAGRITYSQAASYTSCPPRGFINPSLLRGLDPEGNPRRGFDARQSSPLLFTRQAAQDSRMRTLLLGTELSGNGMGVHDEEAIRVEPTGAVDESFGEGGHAVPADSEATVAALAVDPRDRVLLAGRVDKAFYLERLTARGVADPRFGRDGTLRTRFGKSSAQAKAVAIDSRGRIVVLGSVSHGYLGRLALVRYLPGSGRHRPAHRAHHR